MSPNALNLEGALTLTVAVDGGRLSAVALTSQRPVTASRFLVGKTPSEVLTLLPLVFSLCGKAQRTAGLLAIEAGLELEVDAAQMAARRMIVAAESAAENARRILLDWPQLAGASPDLPRLLPIRGALGKIEAALYPEGDAAAPGGGRLACDGAALRDLIAEAEAGIDGIAAGLDAAWDLETFAHWRAHADDGTAALFRGLPSHPVLALPAFLSPDRARAIADRMAAADAADFLARPDLDGVVCETGPLAQHVDTPLVAALLDHDGAGVAARLIARLAELKAAPAHLRTALEVLENGEGGVDGFATSGPLAMVDTARGWLAHRVTLEDGKIADYRILAPTEWNFHPRGTLPNALTGTTYSDEDSLKRLIDVWVAALDPCVACQVDFAGGDHGENG